MTRRGEGGIDWSEVRSVALLYIYRMGCLLSCFVSARCSPFVALSSPISAGDIGLGAGFGNTQFHDDLMLT